MIVESRFYATRRDLMHLSAHKIELRARKYARVASKTRKRARARTRRPKASAKFARERARAQSDARELCSAMRDEENFGFAAISAQIAYRRTSARKSGRERRADAHKIETRRSPCARARARAPLTCSLASSKPPPSIFSQHKRERARQRCTSPPLGIATTTMTTATTAEASSVAPPPPPPSPPPLPSSSSLPPHLITPHNAEGRSPRSARQNSGGGGGVGERRARDVIGDGHHGAAATQNKKRRAPFGSASARSHLSGSSFCSAATCCSRRVLPPNRTAVLTPRLRTFLSNTRLFSAKTIKKPSGARARRYESPRLNSSSSDISAEKKRVARARNSPTRRRPPR